MKKFFQIMNELILIIVQVIAALGVVVSVVYLGIQIKQQNKITKAQFGHSLTQRQYDRFFNTAKDSEYSEFLSKDWSSKDLTKTERWRINHFIVMCLLDLFDVYDKFQDGFVDEAHLNSRINALKLGVMKTDHGKGVWLHYKQTRPENFIKWFENEIWGEDLKLDKSFDEMVKGMNITRE